MSEKINNSGVLAKVIIEVGGTTFGVYLLHMLFLERKWMLILPDALVELGGCSQLLAGFVWTVLTFMFCSLATWVLKKIPIVNSLVS